VQHVWEASEHQERRSAPFLDFDYRKEDLNALDRRLLDICTVTGHVWYFLWIIAWQGPVQQACDYLRRRGVSEQQMVLSIMEGLDFLGRPGSEPTCAPTSALVQLLCSYLPDYFAPFMRSSRGTDLPGKRTSAEPATGCHQ
jgi:hypothetical protein